MLVKNSKHKPYQYFLFFILSIAFIGFLSVLSEKQTHREIVYDRVSRATNFDKLEISIKEKHFKDLKKKRDQALTIGILETNSKDFIPAKVHFNDEVYDASIRLKGDWTDHLAGNKWSYRIKLEGEHTINGMRKFSIHHPGTRGYLNEWLYHQAMKDEDVMGLRYGFLEGIIHIIPKNRDTTHSKNVGIYAIEETFDKRLIESNRRKEGVILKLTEENMWDELALVNKISYETGTRTTDKYNPKYTTDAMSITAFGIDNVLEDSLLVKQFTVANDLLGGYRIGELKASQVFNVDKIAKYTAIANLFGASHGLTTHNLRFYYNPITSLIEPIAFDGNSGIKLVDFRHYWIADRDAKYMDALSQELEKVSDSNYVNNLYSKYKTQLDSMSSGLEKEFDKELILTINNLKENQKKLKKVINTINQ
jgi:hypothetical protein